MIVSERAYINALWVCLAFLVLAFAIPPLDIYSVIPMIVAPFIVMLSTAQLVATERLWLHILGRVFVCFIPVGAIIVLDPWPPVYWMMAVPTLVGVVSVIWRRRKAAPLPARTMELTYGYFGLVFASVIAGVFWFVLVMVRHT